MASEKKIALLGQPNSGKSTVFNMLTGAHQHVGNWPGKTVEKVEGEFTYNNERYFIADLPGTYSLSANSDEEIVTREYIASGGAVRAGAESMAMICGMIIFMAAVMGILGKLRAFGAVSALLSRAIKYPPAQIYPFVRSFLEISNLTRIFGDVTVTIPIAAAMLSFGGILYVCDATNLRLAGGSIAEL